MGYIIGIDFDGTVVTHEYPRVGRDIGAVPVLKKIVESGNRLILFTMRDSKNGTLQDAVNWFKKNGIELYGINTNPTQAGWTDSPKAHCNIYIDDAALGIPKKFDRMTGRNYVDWPRVEQLLEEEGVLDYFDEEEDFEMDGYENNETNENKKMGKVNLTEQQLNSLIENSIKKILKEVSWQRANDAAEMADDNDVFEMVLLKLDDALAEFDEAFDRYNSDAYAGGKMQRNSGIMKYFKETEKVRYFKEKLQSLYDEMKAYNDRKVKQSKNLRQMADEKFSSEHDGQNMFDYEMNLPGDDENMDDKQREFTDYLYR